MSIPQVEKEAFKEKMISFLNFHEGKNCLKAGRKNVDWDRLNSKYKIDKQ